MGMELSGRTAVVTGAGWGGIGGGVAEQFAKEGCNLILMDLDGDRLQESAQRCVSHGIWVEVVQGDAGVQESWDHVLAHVGRRGTDIEIAFHSAATWYSKLLLDFEHKEFQDYCNSNIGSAWLAARNCLPGMRRRKKGSLILVSSVYGHSIGPQRGAYAISKAALNMMVKSIVMDYGHLGIRANAIAPGFIVGPKLQKAIETLPEEDIAARMVQPSGSYGNPEDIAHLAVYLASDKSKFMSGSVLTIDGGMSNQSVEVYTRPFMMKLDPRKK